MIVKKTSGKYKNHAFIMPVHKQPLLMARIIRVLQKENHFFFIHVSSNTKNYGDYVNAVQGLANVQFVKRIPVYWAGISQVKATLILLKAVQDSDVEFDYVHQISGQDYPLRSNDQFDSFFEDTVDSFMMFNYEHEMDYWKPIYEEHSNWNLTNGRKRLFDRAITKIFQKWLRKRFPRKEIEGMAGSSDWWSWSGNVADFVLKEVKSSRGSKLLQRFNRTTAPGEHFFATLLYSHIEELKIRKHLNLRYVSLIAHRKVDTVYRPYNLTELDFNYVVESAAFFCRKVDEYESMKFLDMVDAQRGNKYNIDEHDYFY